jgi:D-hexose-6-phosphate mutarotase
VFVCQVVICFTGETAFSFTTLMHTYFRVDDINKSGVKGLKGVSYDDKVFNQKMRFCRKFICEISFLSIELFHIDAHEKYFV